MWIARSDLCGLVSLERPTHGDDIRYLVAALSAILDIVCLLGCPLAGCAVSSPVFSSGPVDKTALEMGTPPGASTRYARD